MAAAFVVGIMFIFLQISTGLSANNESAVSETAQQKTEVANKNSDNGDTKSVSAVEVKANFLDVTQVSVESTTVTLETLEKVSKTSKWDEICFSKRMCRSNFSSGNKRTSLFIWTIVYKPPKVMK